MTTEEMIRLEEAALDRIKAIRLEKRMSEKALGEAAFSDAGNGQTKLNKYYHAHTGTGKKMRPALGEFLAICAALGEKPEKIIKEITTTEK